MWARLIPSQRYLKFTAENAERAEIKGINHKGHSAAEPQPKLEIGWSGDREIGWSEKSGHRGIGSSGTK